jgi:hypothetical protein
MTRFISIDSDQWEDQNKIWKVLKYQKRNNSSAVELTLENTNGDIEERVVAEHYIKWIT